MRRQKSCVCARARVRVRACVYACMSYHTGIRRRFPACRRPLLCVCMCDFGVCMCLCVCTYLSVNSCVYALSLKNSLPVPAHRGPLVSVRACVCVCVCVNFGGCVYVRAITQEISPGAGAGRYFQPNSA